MSLKAFHCFFVAIGVLVCSAYGMWRLVAAMREGAGELGPAVLSLATGAVLLVHGIHFYKQTEKEPWL
ncbi:MAG: hypothetical protein JNK74_20550 [Candidatus Hydrogenedentes bacterium]|nr:hypothetical protein [Candidatus Hydrogenedentota bacterium]